MRFTKMQGLGNDYVYVNCFEESIEAPGQMAKRLSDRHFGVGADGLILIKPSKNADCRMEMYNADGSKGAMCGNGIRCVAKYVYEASLVRRRKMAVETDSGVRFLTCRVRNGKVHLVDVDMGIPLIMERDFLEWKGETLFFTPVDMGNPHAVFFYTDVDSLDLCNLGPAVELHPKFPDRTNVEFVQILDEQNMKLRVWERGSGETLACGTGACAACAAAVSMGIMKRKIMVHLKGGDLEITWPGAGEAMMMTGPAVEVFRGEIAE